MTQNVAEGLTVSEPTPSKYAFATDDLSMYERIDPAEFPDYDAVDSRDVAERGAPSQARMVVDAEGVRPYDRDGRQTFGGSDGD